MIGRTVDMDDIVLILLNECTQFQTIYYDARQFLEFSGIVQVDQNCGGGAGDVGSRRSFAVPQCGLDADLEVR